MANLKQDIDNIVAEFTHELLSRIQLASTQEQATVLGVSRDSDNRGRWWGKLTTTQRSLVGQKAAATRRRNSSKRTNRKAV
jgi:hypothetical protein